MLRIIDYSPLNMEWKELESEISEQPDLEYVWVANTHSSTLKEEHTAIGLLELILSKGNFINYIALWFKWKD